jgi:hypothetical protein
LPTAAAWSRAAAAAVAGLVTADGDGLVVVAGLGACGVSGCGEIAGDAFADCTTPPAAAATAAAVGTSDGKSRFRPLPVVTIAAPLVVRPDPPLGDVSLYVAGERIPLMLPRERGAPSDAGDAFPLPPPERIIWTYAFVVVAPAPVGDEGGDDASLPVPARCWER